MSDLRELFHALKVESHRKRQANYKASLAWLDAEGIPYRICNELTMHTLVMERIDFWPSTGKWKERKKFMPFRRGVKSLIAYVKKESNED